MSTIFEDNSLSIGNTPLVKLTVLQVGMYTLKLNHVILALVSNAVLVHQ